MGDKNLSIPFIIYALPRSRTAWLSRFLTYGEWVCHHEQAMYWRSLGNMRWLYAQPNTGSIETAAAQAWQLIDYVAPTIKKVVILRPVDDVVKSTLAIDINGIGVYDEKLLRHNMEYGHRMLHKISQLSDVLTINYEDLQHKKQCSSIFEHCLPYKFDENWWDLLKDTNIQVNARDIIKYAIENRTDIKEFQRYLKKELRELYKQGLIKSNRII